MIRKEKSFFDDDDDEVPRVQISKMSGTEAEMVVFIPLDNHLVVEIHGERIAPAAVFCTKGKERALELTCAGRESADISPPALPAAQKEGGAAQHLTQFPIQRCFS
uniref:Uncharacterized protein n=1 Tax=Ditylenchus dipsaci TaxID=166011 RepID=A0A915CXT0_9BILA